MEGLLTTEGRQQWNASRIPSHESRPVIENTRAELSAERQRLRTYRNEDVQKVLQSGELRNELLHHFAEGLKDGVVVDTGQVKAEWDFKK